MSESLPAKQLLPTLSSTSSLSTTDHKLAAKSSCPGTFFHLFDWNCHLHRSRIFGNKSIPSGQPSSVRKDDMCTEEVLPSPNLPLVAVVEDRGTFPAALGTTMEDAFQKDRTPEKRKKKRSPNVVAKLMGLETMPSPEPCRRPRRPLDAQNPNLLRTPEEHLHIANSRALLIRQKTHELDRNIGGFSARIESRRKDLLPDLSLKQGNDNGTKVNKPNAQMQSPLIIEPVIPSHAKTQIKLPAAGNSENIQENIEDKKVAEKRPPAARSLKLQCLPPNVYPADMTAQSAVKKDKEVTRAQDAHPASRQQAASRLVASQTSTSNVSAKEETTRQLLSHGRNAKKDKGQIKRHLSQQDLSSIREEKVKPDFKRQDQPCMRLSQTEGVKNQSSRLVKAKAKTDACPLKLNLARAESHNYERDLSSDSTITSVEHDVGGSSIDSICKHKRLSSSAKDTRDKIKVQKTGTRGDSSPYAKSLATRRGTAQASRERKTTCDSTVSLKHARVRNQPPSLMLNEDVLDATDITEECITECSSANQHYGSLYSECSHEDLCSVDKAHMTTLQDDSDAGESSVTVENDIACNRLHDGETQGASGPSTESTFRDNVCKEVAVKSSSNVIGIAESTCQSSCKSCVEDAGDTASSYETKNQKQTVSYSGKSTATILKELLMALNPSTKEFITEDTSIHDQATSSLNDARITKTAGINSIDYIRGQGLNHHADSAFNDDGLCNNTSKAFNELSQEGKHSLIECTNSCWQLTSSNLALVPPSQCKSSISSQSFFSIQEREDCGEESFRDLLDSESFGRDEILSSLSSQEHTSSFSNLQAKFVQSEEDYVRHILSRANLSPANIHSARLLLSGPLIKPALYTELEENFRHHWKWGIHLEQEHDDVCTSNEFTGFHYDDAARVHRKLVFDCVGEVLRLDMGVNEQESQQNGMPFLQLCSPEPCSRQVQRRINDWRDMACGINVDDMVEKEMNSGIGKWVDFPCEEYEISVEVEVGIFRDLIDELVLDLSTVLQKVPTRMTCKMERQGKGNRDQHFWVGL